MIKLIFHEILIVSHKERTAFQATLDKKTTIFIGSNRSGKSFLIKCLYSALGAFPIKMPKEWRDISPYILLKFSINEKQFTVLLRNGEHIFYDTDFNIIGRHPSGSHELSHFIANLLQYNIHITTENNNITLANPYFTFSPFYIDQDTGWNKPWSSFSTDTHSTIRKSEAVHYYTGIVSEEYCNTKSDIDRTKKDIHKQETYINALEETFKHLSENLPDKLTILHGIELSDALNTNLAELNKLIKRKQYILNKIGYLNSKIEDLNELQKISHRTLTEISSDHALFNEKAHFPEIICPTCLAHYDTSISERFNIIHDEIRCRETLDENETVILKTKAALARLRHKLLAIDHALRDRLNFNKEISAFGNLDEIISLHSTNRLYTIADDLLSFNKNEHRNLLLTLHNQENKLKQLFNFQNKHLISNKFKLLIVSFFKHLGFTSNDNISTPTLSGRIPEIGSSVARITLAYYYAILHIIYNSKKTPLCPIVLDAPNQLSVETHNLKKMISFIINNSPEHSQLILATEDLHDTPTISSIIHLQSRPQLLQRKQYHDTWDSMRIYSDKAPLSSILALF